MLIINKWRAALLLGLLASAASARAQQPVVVQDPTTPTQKAAVNGSGQLSITCANCSGSGASAVDESAFTQGTNSVAPSGILFKTTYTALTSGQVGIWRGFSDGSGFVMGSVASGATDTGNPIKVGGVYNSSPITLTTGQRGDLQLDANGYTKVNIAAGGSTTVTEAATITANQANAALTSAVVYGFDGTTDSRLRTRAGTIGSTDVGLVTRPFLPSDGTNTTPAGDAAARAIFHKVTDGTNTVVIDPCQGNTKSFGVIDLASTTATELIAGTSAKKTYICSISLVSATAQNVGVWSGTTTTTACDTGKGKMFGGSTAATGWNLAANGGLVLGSGVAAIAVSGANADKVCITSSGAGQLSGNFTYVVQ